MKHFITTQQNTQPIYSEIHDVKHCESTFYCGGSAPVTIGTVNAGSELSPLNIELLQLQQNHPGNCDMSMLNPESSAKQMRTVSQTRVLRLLPFLPPRPSMEDPRPPKETSVLFPSLQLFLFLFLFLQLFLKKIKPLNVSQPRQHQFCFCFYFCNYF